MAGRKFEFPEPLEACPNLDRFLVPAAVEKGDDRLSNCARKNVLKAKKTLKSQGLEVDKLCNEVVVDAAAGKSFFSYMENRSPCVTKARGGQRGFYFLKAGRYMNLYEIAGLQGWRKSWVTHLLETYDSKTRLGQALGDAMSLNVLQRLLPRALWALNLIDEMPRDRWAEACRLAGPMPETVYKTKTKKL